MAVIEVISVCFITLRTVFASFGSGVYTTGSHVISGIMVLIVNQKLWKGGRKPRSLSFICSSNTSSDHLIFSIIFLCVKGTAFGRDSEPEVKRITAILCPFCSPSLLGRGLGGGLGI